MTSDVVTTTVTVVVGIGRHIRPLVVWAGDRTRTEDTLIVGFQRFERRPHLVDAARQIWKSEVNVPVGRVVTTSKRWPTDDEIFWSTPTGLEPMSRADAMDHLDPDPIRIADRADQRILDQHADAAGIPRTLTRFVGAHDLENGIHPRGSSLYFAERCTARQGWWRRLTLAEWRAYEERVLRGALDTFEAAWAAS